MTDNNIIKALKCHIDDDSSCAECPYFTSDEECLYRLIPETLNLINRQKAKIDSLQQDNNLLRVRLDDCERDIIPKLKYSLKRANEYGMAIDKTAMQHYKEGVQDLAQRLHDMTKMPSDDDIDYYVKELTGEQYESIIE